MSLKRIKPDLKIIDDFLWLDRYTQGQDVFPATIEIDPSNRCPLACRHCVWSNYIATNKQWLSADVLMTLVHQIKELNIRGIIWTGGGEPLSNAATIKGIEEAFRLGLSNAMFTNAVLLSSKVSDILVKHLKWIRFNIGADNSHDYSNICGVSERVFLRVVNNIKYFTHSFPRDDAGVGIAVNRDNFEIVQKMPCFAIELGVGFFQVKPDYNYIMNDNYHEWWRCVVLPYFERIRKQLDKEIKVVVYDFDCRPTRVNYCHAHHLVTSITADGRVSFCKMKRDEEDCSIGNIYEMPLREIFSGAKNKTFSHQNFPSTCTENKYCPYGELNEYIDQYKNNELRVHAHASEPIASDFY